MNNSRISIKSAPDPLEAYRRFLINFSLNEQKICKANPRETFVDAKMIGDIQVNRYCNEFWTSRQRQACSLHEISYRACFKPQLPRFFILALTKKGDMVYDPFSGRGTTALEAALHGRRFTANDVNPLSRILTEPRLSPPDIQSVEKRLSGIPLSAQVSDDMDLSMFYHPDTEREIKSLKAYLEQKKKQNTEDCVDKWIRMVATNRLTGHSPGFFSVYSLPPNQAVSPESQLLINKKRNQVPEYRDVRALIIKKSRQLLKGIEPLFIPELAMILEESLFVNQCATSTSLIPGDSVHLTVTSPPFLNVVQYAQDNWLRCWFNSLAADEIAGKITVTNTIKKWSATMADVFQELYRVTRPGGWTAFEVGEVNKGKVKLDEHVVPLGLNAGFECFGILINRQKFTKTSNIWGVSNNTRGTNTNRIVLFYKK